MSRPKDLCTGCICRVNEGFSTMNIMIPEVAMATKETASDTAAIFLSMGRGPIYLLAASSPGGEGNFAEPKRTVRVANASSRMAAVT